jgi:hypothetical protein
MPSRILNLVARSRRGSTDVGSYVDAHADNDNNANTNAGTDAVMAVTKVREELVEWIAEEALGGDHGGDWDAAEWVLLVSIVYVRACSFCLPL